MDILSVGVVLLGGLSVVAGQEFSSFTAESAKEAAAQTTAASGKSILASKFLQPAGGGFTPEAWNAMTILQRVQAYDWTKEAVILASILAYILLHMVGVRLNRRKVTSWISANKEVLTNQFYQVGTRAGADTNDLLSLTEEDGATAYTTYATGRLNVQSLIVRFRLLGRQNFITLSMEYITSFFFNGFTPRDAVDVVITPDKTASKKIEPFIFAIVHKEKMRTAREDNYYLSLTRTVDSAKLPPTFTFMSEATEINEALFTEELSEAIQEAGNVLNYIAITDQASNAPSGLEDVEPQTLVAISLNYPSNEAEGRASAKLINTALNLVDHLVSKKPWRPEVARKIKATREAEIKKIQRSIEAAKAEEIAQKKAEQKREETKSERNLSQAEQKKLEQKRREKDMRKARNRQTRRG